MLRKIVGLAGVLGFLLLGACSSDSNFGGGSSVQQVNLIDNNGDPITGATLWVPVNNPLAMSAGAAGALATVTDSQGNTCGDPLSDDLQFACSNSIGKALLQCSPGQSLSVLVALNDTEIGSFTLACTGTPITQTLTTFLGEIFVANYGGNTVGVFDVTDEGDIAPLREISGPSTSLAGPAGIAIVGDELYVGNYLGNNITVYPVDADGDVAPTRTITSTVSFGFIDSLSIFNGKIYVSNQSDSLFIVDAAADGMITPTVLNGASTGLDQTGGALVIGDELLVVDGDEIRTFNVTDSGDVAPQRVIAGASTLLSNSYNLQLIGTEMVTAACSLPGIVFFPPTASGDVAPSHAVFGASTQFNCPTGVFPAGDEVGVSDFSVSTISFFPVTADGDVAPTHVIAGPSTNLSNPWGTVSR